ncbi:hypothetical protein Ssi02_13150 [Sinosporangium siamense]|uniref:Uncharacterized protein n=1 Tax=Sinosporangium siamense TaxID=1367973 RepID=A0A919VAG2_9ACTN|nr:hypothetical protein Ssi02_13150 [Sinosporangium siamense]
MTSAFSRGEVAKGAFLRQLLFLRAGGMGVFVSTGGEGAWPVEILCPEPGTQVFGTPKKVTLWERFITLSNRGGLVLRLPR